MVKDILSKVWQFIKRYKWFFSGGLALVVIGVTALIIVLNVNANNAVPVSNPVSAVSSSSSEVSSEISSSSEVTSEVTSSAVSSSSEVSSSSQAASSAAHKHKWVKGKTVAPTVDEKGYTNYSCACGQTKKDDWKDKLINIEKPKITPGPLGGNDQEKDEETPDGTYESLYTDPNGYECDIVYVKSGKINYVVYDYRDQHKDLTTKQVKGGVKVSYFDSNGVAVNVMLETPTGDNNSSMILIFPDGTYELYKMYFKMTM